MQWRLELKTYVSVLALTLAAASPAFGCWPEKTCSQMKSCAEAAYYLTICGHGKRDGDDDGIPCEELCGQTQEEYKRRREAVTFEPETGSAALPRDYSCGEKNTCGQMDSCAEAKFYLDQCGLRRLDRDGDGIPCDSLCR